MSRFQLRLRYFIDAAAVYFFASDVLLLFASYAAILPFTDVMVWFFSK